MTYEDQLEKLVVNALQEDLGSGDYSTLSTVSPEQQGLAILKIKQDGVLAGVAIAEKMFRHVQPDVEFQVFKKDGEEMQLSLIHI